MVFTTLINFLQVSVNKVAFISMPRPKPDQARAKPWSMAFNGFQKPWLRAEPSHCQAIVNGFGLARGLRKPEPPRAKPKSGL